MEKQMDWISDSKIFGKGKLATPAGAAAEKMESILAPYREVDALPLMYGTPTGLCDRRGEELKEGDFIIVENCSGVYQVRFWVGYGFVAYYNNGDATIQYSLGLLPRSGKVFRRRWLKDVMKRGA